MLKSHVTMTNAVYDEVFMRVPNGATRNIEDTGCGLQDVNANVRFNYLWLA